MAINFNSFTEGTTSTIQSNDYVVGFDTAVPGGERKWQISTLANAVSGIMNAQLDADIVNSTNVTVLSASLSAAPFNAKAWVNFNGTTSPGTIRSSYNVSSVTKNGTGQYTVNFANSLLDANYSVTASVIGSTTQSDAGAFPYNVSIVGNLTNTLSTTGFRFQIGKSQTVDPVAVDVNCISVQVFGN